MLRQIFYILAVPVLMTSCATIFNSPYKHVTIHTTEPSKIIYKQDTINTIDDKTHLRVERNWETLNIVATTDSLTKSIRIGAKNSTMYWSNILFNYGLGMLVERNNPKRYTYPGKIYINSEGATGQYSLYGIANNKGELYLHYSNPIINPFRMMPENLGAKVRTGFMGGTIGLDYYHSKNQFIHLGVSEVSGGWDLIFFNNEYELMSSDYIGLSNNHKIGRFSIGYGLSYAKNIWDFRDHGDFYEYDEFKYEEGLEPILKHIPFNGDRGKPIYYYSVCEIKNGGKSYAVMSKAEIEAHRFKFAKGKDKVDYDKLDKSSAWYKFFDEMALKTTMIKALAEAPNSLEVQTIINFARDDFEYIPTEFTDMTNNEVIEKLDIDNEF
jgi:hypothetical protein